MVCFHVRSACKKYEYLYSLCKGHDPLTVARQSKRQSRRVRADRLDETVWQALTQFLHKPEVIPQRHATWAEAKQQNSSAIEPQQAQWLGRRQKIERQNQRLLDAFQAEVINLAELQARRQKLSAELQRIEQEAKQLANTRQQTIHWQEVIEHAESFCQLVG